MGTLDIRDINLKLRYNHRKNMWVGYSHYWQEFFVQAPTLDEVMDEFKLKLGALERPQDDNPIKTIRAALAKAIYFIQYGFIAIVQNFNEDCYWLYCPEFKVNASDLDLNDIKLQKFRLEDSDAELLDNLLAKLGQVDLPHRGSGLDGCIHSIRIGGGWNSVEYEWWSDSAGEQWQPVYDLRSLLNEFSSKYN